jgi:hypothetical protein
VTFDEFRSLQEMFDATVRDALRYGPSWGLQDQYRRHRSALQALYPQFRGSLQHLFEAPEKTGFHRPIDPVEWLLSHPTLDRLLLRESLEVADRLEQVRAAVMNWKAPVGVG